MAPHSAAMSAFRVSGLVLLLAACGPQPPRLDAVVPAAGDAAGGAQVRLEGAGFVGRGAAVVYFGMRSARAVVVEDDGLITVKTPEAEALGPTDLRVQFADGTVLARAQAYSYSSPDGKLKPIPFVPGKVPVPEAAAP